LVGYEDRGTPYRALARAAEHRECRFWRIRWLSLALFAVDLTVVAVPFGIEDQESGTALEAREEEGALNVSFSRTPKTFPSSAPHVQVTKQCELTRGKRNGPK
jgi:hypothetical protein